MKTNEITRLAVLLDEASLHRKEIERLTLDHPQLSLEEAYLIQDAGISLRTSRGEQIVGFKMGLTSAAKRQQMNLNSPIYGVLTNQMRVPDQGRFFVKNSIHPKIEPEIAFVVGRDLKGPVSFEEALDACFGVGAALEILDSRFLGFKYFSLPDVVADNCSSSYFILSDQLKDPKKLDFGNLKMTLEVNGTPVHQASSREISGHPLNSLVQLCEMLHQRGLSLRAGSIVLAGAATQAVSLERDKMIRLYVQDLGQVSVAIV